MPDEIVLDMVRQALVAAAATGGGYAWTASPQHEAGTCDLPDRLEMGMITKVALRLQVEDGELVRRLLARAALEGHADDTEAVIRRRLSCTTR